LGIHGCDDSGTDRQAGVGKAVDGVVVDMSYLGHESPLVYIYCTDRRGQFTYMYISNSKLVAAIGQIRHACEHLRSNIWVLHAASLFLHIRGVESIVLTTHMTSEVAEYRWLCTPTCNRPRTDALEHGVGNSTISYDAEST